MSNNSTTTVQIEPLLTYILATTVTVIGSFLSITVFVVIIQTKTLQQNPSNYLFLNLALNCLLHCLASPLLLIVSGFRPDYDSLWNKILAAVDATAWTATYCSLSVISYDRFLAIRQPLDIEKRRVIILKGIAKVWLSAGLAAAAAVVISFSVYTSPSYVAWRQIQTGLLVLILSINFIVSLVYGVCVIVIQKRYNRVAAETFQSSQPSTFSSGIDSPSKNKKPTFFSATSVVLVALRARRVGTTTSSSPTGSHANMWARNAASNRRRAEIRMARRMSIIYVLFLVPTLPYIVICFVRPEAQLPTRSFESLYVELWITLVDSFCMLVLTFINPQFRIAYVFKFQKLIKSIVIKYFK